MKAEPYPNPIQLTLSGVDTVHDAGYTVDRPAGTTGYLVEFFDTPVELEDSSGRRPYEGGVFILYSPGHRQYFRATAPLRHTWFQVDGDGVRECVDQYGIPVNQGVEIARPDFLAPLLDEARQHAVRKNAHWEDAVTETMRRLFRSLARALFGPDVAQPSPYEKHVATTLHRVRAQVFKDLRRRWTVEDMASLANMSAARFAAAYRSEFDSGPIEDLIDVRLRHAETLLMRLPISVYDAARLSGFNSPSNFHVRFRERMGRGPRRLRPEARGASIAVDAEEWTEMPGPARQVELLYLRPAGHWSFEDSYPVVDDLRKHPPATLVGNARIGPGRLGGRALHFDGDSYAIVPEVVIDTSRSYTVSVWVTCTEPGRMTGVCIGNEHHGAFYLQYITLEGGFKFAVTVSERDPLAVAVIAEMSVSFGAWYHLAGVHDADRGEIRLYVDGNLKGAQKFRTPWTVTGVTYFGACQLLDTMIDQWRGAIDDVRIYDEALADADIRAIYTAPEVAYERVLPVHCDELLRMRIRKGRT